MRGLVALILQQSGQTTGNGTGGAGGFSRIPVLRTAVVASLLVSRLQVKSWYMPFIPGRNGHQTDLENGMLIAADPGQQVAAVGS